MTGTPPDGQQTGVLVAGGGQTGLAVASELRALGYAKALTLIGGEPCLPYQRPPLSKGFLSGAGEQATAAAHALLGLEPPDRGVAWFWSDQGNLKIQIAGISHGHDAYVERREVGRLTVLYFRARRLLAADAVDNPRDFMAVKRALASGATLDPDRAGDLAVSVRELLEERA